MATVDSAETPTTVKSVARSFSGCAGSAAASASAAEAPQIAVAPPLSRPNRLWKPISARHQHRHADRQHHRDDDDRHRLPAERGDLAEGDAQAEQGDADAQHLARGELDAGGARAVAGEEVHRHAEQQREQHHRRAVVLREEGRRRGDDHAGQHPGEQRLGAPAGRRRPKAPSSPAQPLRPWAARARRTARAACSSASCRWRRAGSRRRRRRRRASTTWRSCRRRSASSSSRVSSAPGFFTTTSSGRSSHFGWRAPMQAAIATAGMRHRDVLEVDRADPFAAGLDHVLAAVGDLHVAVGVDRGDVAGREPAVDQRVAAFALEVARDDPRAAHQQLAARPCRRAAAPGRRRRRSSCRRRRPRGPAWPAPPCAPRRRAQVLGLERADGADRAHLGHAPGVQHLRRRSAPGRRASSPAGRPSRR